MATDPNPPEAASEQRLFAAKKFAETYEQSLVEPLFRPWVAPLLDEVELKPGEHVLDIACGTGIVARMARERVGAAGKVVGVDVNPHMLAVARQVAPDVDWREGEAGMLPLSEEERFDVILCQQGFQFFPDRAAAARQMRRALVDGGRVAISTWRSDVELAVLRQLRSIAERHVGPVDDRRHSLGDPAPVEAALREAGFHDIRTAHHTRTIRFSDGALFVRLNAMAMVTMSAAAGTLDETERLGIAGMIADDSAEIVRMNSDGNGFAYEMGTNVVVADAIART